MQVDGERDLKSRLQKKGFWTQMNADKRRLRREGEGAAQKRELKSRLQKSAIMLAGGVRPARHGVLVVGRL